MHTYIHTEYTHYIKNQPKNQCKRIISVGSVISIGSVISVGSVVSVEPSPEHQQQQVINAPSHVPSRHLAHLHLLPSTPHTGRLEPYPSQSTVVAAHTDGRCRCLVARHRVLLGAGRMQTGREHTHGRPSQPGTHRGGVCRCASTKGSKKTQDGGHVQGEQEGTQSLKHAVEFDVCLCYGRTVGKCACRSVMKTCAACIHASSCTCRGCCIQARW